CRWWDPPWCDVPEWAVAEDEPAAVSTPRELEPAQPARAPPSAKAARMSAVSFLGTDSVGQTAHALAELRQSDGSADRRRDQQHDGANVSEAHQRVVLVHPVATVVAQL